MLPSVIFWLFLLPEILSQTWKICTFLPEKIYFPAEEFLALNNHHNSLYIIAGGFFIALFTVIFALKANGKPQKLYEYFLLIIIISAMILMLMPCLCAPAEHARRIRCQSYLKEIFITCDLYALEHEGFFPDSTDINKLKHSVRYFGKNKKRTDSPFVVLEDAEKIHAGNMRHQIWSNGEIRKVYTWKEVR